MYLTANLLNQTCAGGASMLTRKSVLETVGGLGHFGQYLAEDFFLAKDVAEWVQHLWVFSVYWHWPSVYTLTVCGCHH